MTQDAVFRSVSQALHVSFLMASLPVTQKGNTQAALERLMEQAGVRTEVVRDGTLNFRGLSSMEVRGQCAMVRGAVLHHCTEMERHAIHAWFAHDPSKADGVHALRDYCAGHLTIESPSACTLIVWAVHAQGRARDMCTERAIAAEHQLSQMTVHRNIVIVQKAAGRLRRAGMDRLSVMFERDGLIASEAAMEGS
jgi:hypothetical protein